MALSEQELRYVNYMTEIKLRIDFLQSQQLSTFPKQVGAELIAVQLRKIVEMILFSSLLVNRSEYEAAHKDAAKHWRIKEIIANIKRLNPNYLPIPITEFIRDGQKYWDYPMGEQFFSEDDLVAMYQDSSQIIHSYMPFVERSADIDVFLSKVNARIAKIIRTLNGHKILPPSGDDFFVLHMLEEGRPAPTVYTFKTVKRGTE